MPSAEDEGRIVLSGALATLPLREARELFEREYLLTQINRFGGNISRTATFVGMERSALHRKLKSLGVVTTSKSGARVHAASSRTEARLRPTGGQTRIRSARSPERRAGPDGPQVTGRRAAGASSDGCVDPATPPYIGARGRTETS